MSLRTTSRNIGYECCFRGTLDMRHKYNGGLFALRTLSKIVSTINVSSENKLVRNILVCPCSSLKPLARNILGSNVFSLEISQNYSGYACVL